MLEAVAGVGQLWNADWQALHRLAANGDHPAAVCLREGKMQVVRGNDERLARGATRPTSWSVEPSPALRQARLRQAMGPRPQPPAATRPRLPAWDN